MIQRFSFGHPFPTESVVQTLPICEGRVPFLQETADGWQFSMSEDAAVYGLGEMPRGLNKRGWHYIANNTDESHHSEDKLSYYGAHNFLLIRLIPIIDAGIRIDPDEPTCQEGLSKGYFCKKADGTPFVAAVWPGKAYFADFLRPKVREWFGGRYQLLTDLGIEGFWNDMNEPALFYSPERPLPVSAPASAPCSTAARVSLVPTAMAASGWATTTLRGDSCSPTSR